MAMDPINLELFYHKLKAITEEMGIALSRTALSSYVKETQDFGTALCNRSGKFFACPVDTGIALAVDLDCGRFIAATDSFEPGDIVITNHPYLAAGVGSHLPDINLLKPYFHDGKLVCFGWSFAHCSDIGGAVPSSISPSFDNLFQEGFQIPPMKLMSRGVMDESFIRLLRTNSRTPDVVIGDLRAQIAALAVGERRVAEVISQHGVDEFEIAQEELVDYAKRRALVVQKLIPDGEYSFWDYLDDDYRSGIPVRLRCRMKVDSGRIDMDLEGSDPQLAAPYNVPTGGNRHPYLTTKILHLLASYDRDLPLNSGLFENIGVSVPLGSVMNPEFPAPVGIRHATAIRFADVVLGCLSQAAPEMVPAASGGAVIPVVVSQVDRAGGRRSVAVIQALAGGAGATARMDGADGRDRSLANIRNTPTEAGEADVGVRVEQYGLRPDSGGPGQFRGGAGIIYSIRVLRDGTQILGRGLERFVFRPWGANGGQPGQSARVILNIGSQDQQELGKIDVVRAREGDLLTIMTPGGGGYGDPFSRDSRLVQQDVRYGLVTAAAARADYGVSLDPVTFDIDETATADIRAHRASSATGFGFDPIRKSWECLFDDSSMTALANALLKIPAGFRSEERLALFEKVLPGVAKRGAMAVLDHDFNIDHARARLASEIHELGVRWCDPS